MTRILILDDELEMGRLMAMIVRRRGYTCAITDDSYEAWALLHTLDFDLFTQDTMRPDVDGIEFYHAVRADAGLDDLPLVMVTAKSPPEDRARVFDAGLDGYLTKPFGPEELEHTLAEALRQRGCPVPAGVAVEEELRATAQLVEGLRAERWEARLAAARALGLRRDEEVVEPLLVALDDSVAGVRWAVALALGRMGAGRALQPLVAALDDQHALVRMMAAHALGMLGAVQAGRALVERLDDDDVWVRRAAVHALGALQDATATPALVRTLHAGGASLRAEAARALGHIGGPALDPLVACLDAEDVTLRRVVVANGFAWAREDPRVEAALVDALRDPDAGVRGLAVQLLSWRRSPQAAEPLMAALEDESADVAAGAARILGGIKDPRALPALERAMRDTRSFRQGDTVADVARRAIEEIRAARE
jgi:HEAT repeat protein